MKYRNRMLKYGAPLVVLGATITSASAGTIDDIVSLVSTEIGLLIVGATTLVGVAIGIWIIPVSVRVLKNVVGKLFAG